MGRIKGYKVKNTENYQGNSAGEKNGNWNGGISEYPNHYLMKKNRILKLKQTKGLCEICGRRGFQIHHIDDSKDNHSLKNLILVCWRCHCLIHCGRKNKTSKFIRLYGATLEKLSEKLKIPSGTIWKWHTENKLKEFLKNKK